MERMNYINRPKPAYTQEEWIEYLEESIRELRKEKENLKKEKGEIRQRLVALEKKLETLSRVKENKELREENKKLRDYADNLDSENDNQAIEIEELKKENKKLKKYYDRDKEELMESCYGLARENDELNEKVRFLEECLDNKEKLNEKYRKEIEKLKSTYVYDAKQVRDIC